MVRGVASIKAKVRGVASIKAKVRGVARVREGKLLWLGQGSSYG